MAQRRRECREHVWVYEFPGEASTEKAYKCKWCPALAPKEVRARLGACPHRNKRYNDDTMGGCGSWWDWACDDCGYTCTCS